MRVAVFGGTGNTGACVVSLALDAGYEVAVLVRDPLKLEDDVKSKLAKVVEGNVLEENSVREAIKGSDGVVVVLGTRNDLSATTVMSQGLKNILHAMKMEDVKRISVCLSGFLFFEEGKLPARFQDLTAEHKRMLDILQSTEAADINWIAVCPPHISDDPPSKNYNIVVGKSPGRRIAKGDLADFLIKSASSNSEYVRQAVGIGYESIS